MIRNRQDAGGVETVTGIAGMAAFVEGEDQCVLDVFSRADYLMYTHKNEYKASLAREERT